MPRLKSRSIKCPDELWDTFAKAIELDGRFYDPSRGANRSGCIKYLMEVFINSVECDRMYGTHSECKDCLKSKECEDMAKVMKPNPSDYEDEGIIL